MDREFKFNLDQRVTITESGESGDVIGRAEYSKSENHYFIRYKAGDGRATQDWWGESALHAA
ncbi:hypothetical protein SAMN04487785_102426 [Dyella jiangningensis]|uniref:hypothetical protein n=1 Tax=Dyella sp. AtDHG13 TaxID=1938897 RepID=UPI00088EAF6E|nr:hypothetical protein [Dyella sp. AtDHG13]PXV60698.1 hypothetical protein BDW41_102425 [Dyella sp. AtDHG13]SDJ55601.1 hypothetical protein SAMN04487785_102426 [Dyella jiangningensis]